MAITVVTTDTHTTSTTEWSMVSAANYNIGTTFSTSDGVYQLGLDLTDMVLGDEVQVRIYEKVGSGSTQRVVYQANISGKGSGSNCTKFFPSLLLMHGWDMTLDAIAGTPDIGFTIYKVA